MVPFERLLFRTLGHEGYTLTDDSNDHGGTTFEGISLLFLQHISKEDADINGDGVVDSNDVKALTQDEVFALYKKYFYDKNHLAQINSDRVRWKVFDIGVNCGTGIAAEMLQRAVGATIDGALGPQTFMLVNGTDQNSVLLNLMSQQSQRYKDIVAKKPDQHKFLTGWLNRAIDLGVGLA